MAKTLEYPTAEWLDALVDRTGCSLEEAEMAWWDKQVDKGNPTPWDLTPEQEKESRKANRPKTHKVVDPSGKAKTRERKPNEDKRALVAVLASCLSDCHRHEDEPTEGVEQVQVVNPERQVDFHLNGVHYSVTLTAHRPPKAKGKS